MLELRWKGILAVGSQGILSVTVPTEDYSGSTESENTVTTRVVEHPGSTESENTQCYS